MRDRCPRIATTAVVIAVLLGLCPGGAWAVPVGKSTLMAGMQEVFQGWRTQQAEAPGPSGEAAPVGELWTWLVRAHGPSAVPTLAETYAAVLPSEVARLTGLVDMVRDQELGSYGWGAWLEAPGSRLLVTPEGLVILTGGPRVSHDCASGAVALTQRLAAEGYSHPAIATGWATDGIDEVFVRVGAGPTRAIHALTVVPGRVPVDDPRLRVSRLLTAAEAQQLAEFSRAGAILGGQGDRLYPMAIVPTPRGDRMLFAGIAVGFDRVRLRFQTRAVAGDPAIHQLELLMPRSEWPMWQTHAGHLRPDDLLARLQRASRITVNTLSEVSSPRVAALAAAILWKLDLTPRPFSVPDVVVNQGNTAVAAP